MSLAILVSQGKHMQSDLSRIKVSCIYFAKQKFLGMDKSSV